MVRAELHARTTSGRLTRSGSPTHSPIAPASSRSGSIPSRDKSTRVTDGLAEAGDPAFDQNGKYLYFLASTDAGPVNNWFDQSNTDMRATSTIYLLTLATATANPLLKESDEEGAGDADKKPSDDKDKQKDKDKDKDKEKEKEKPATAIDLEGIAARIVALPAESGHIADLTSGADGQIYYIRRPAAKGEALAAAV